MRRSASATAVLLAVLLSACPRKDPTPDPAVKDAAASSSTTTSTSPPDEGSAAHGKELVLTYECNRCHDGTGHPAAPQEKNCVHCHKDIMEGRFSRGTPATMARWKPRVKEYADVPSLEAADKRWSRRWIVDYLLQPSDLRPHLHADMPRLAMSLADAKDIAAYLAPSPKKDDPSAILGADLGRGRKVLDTKGCGACHVFTGVAAIENSPPPAMDGKVFEVAHRIAPDLSVVRQRTNAAELTAWLADPRAVKSDTTMPKIALSPQEIKDVAGYILTAEVTAPPAPAKLERLPVLPASRRVTFKEVDEKVFHRTCWHCHSEPDYAIGDGGPGNSGGLGFKPRGLNLSSYEGIAAGFVDDHGERQSVFAKDAAGVPRLVRALMARHEEEEQNVATGEVRGMPLGYDALSLEEIQLVETWIAEGRPQ